MDVYSTYEQIEKELKVFGERLKRAKLSQDDEETNKLFRDFYKYVRRTPVLLFFIMDLFFEIIQNFLKQEMNKK